MVPELECFDQGMIDVVNDLAGKGGLKPSFGFNVRVGLADNVWFDADRTRLAVNMSLSRRIHEPASIFGRRPMTPAAFGTLGSYNRRRSGAST